MENLNEMQSQSVVDDPTVTLPIGNYHQDLGLQGHCKDQASIILLEYFPLSPLSALQTSHRDEKTHLNLY